MTAQRAGYSKRIISIIIIAAAAFVLGGPVVKAQLFRTESALQDTNQDNSLKTTALPDPAEVREAPAEPAERVEPPAEQAIAQPAPTEQEDSLPFNQLVLAQIKTYAQGSYPYLLNTDYANYNGVTSNLYYQGKLLLKAHPSGNRASHCVGITFEVFFRSLTAWNRQQGFTGDSIKGLSYEQLYDFIQKWYVAGPKTTNNLVIALEKYQLGKRITDFEAARPGDFMDFSRENQTGHTVVFINWVRVNGRIVGMRYWSSQESTEGIAYKTEYFNTPRQDGGKYGLIMENTVLIGRVIPPVK